MGTAHTQNQADEGETMKDIKYLALQRAEEILESWWYECTGEWADEMGLTDEQMEEVLSTPFEVRIL
jgi:hypothetical protein